MATSESKKKWNGSIDNNPKAKSGDIFNISLSYPGKKDASEVLLETPRPELRLLWQNSINSPNRFYFGDNLFSLAKLMDDKTVRGKVDLIYIDPPFSTNGVFKSRSQNDAYHDLLQGADFIEFLRHRLIFLRELLSDKGSIYMHLDSTMVFHIKLIMDELFGKNQFRNLITRRKCNPKNFTRNQYGNISDFILFYTKTDDYIWNRPLEPWTDEKLDKEYQYVEPDTGRRYKKVPVHAPGVRNGATGQAWRGKLPPPGKHWQYTPASLDEMDARGEIYWSPTGNPRRKVYADQSQGLPIQDIWLDVKDAHNQNIKISGYPTEKPSLMLERIIQASSNEQSLVLDCFSGSATTLFEATRLKRHWIGMDNSIEAVATMLRRFESGLEVMGDYVNSHKTNSQNILPLMWQPLVRDFDLFAVEPYSGEIDAAVDEWKKL